MGQKVHPIGIRLGYYKDWSSKWYAKGTKFADNLNADIKARTFLMSKLKNASVSEILIERLAQSAKISVFSARPGVIIGKKGGEIDGLRSQVSKIMNVPVHITIEEVKKPELNAKLVADSIAQQLERRVMFRRAMKKSVQSTMRQGALGIKICLSGRLAGAEIARKEVIKEGRIPLHTFRADIDYSTASAHTTYGVIGVKVWIFKGEVQKTRTKIQHHDGDDAVKGSGE